MKILSKQQIKKMDKYCIDYELISYDNLMERSSKRCFEWIKSNILNIKKIPIIILVGVGNNGGDGLAISRMLYLYGSIITIYNIHFSDHVSDNYKINKKRILKYGIKIYDIYKNDKFPILNKKSYLIDSIFGIGFNSNYIDKYWISFFNFINNIKFKSVISIDIPSGISIDRYSNIDPIKSNYTLTFQTPKLPFFFKKYYSYVGKWYILDIGWNKKMISKIKTNNIFLDYYSIKNIKKIRHKFSHKGDFGHGLIIGGSYGMIGSVILSSKACIRSGIGKLSIYTPSCGFNIIQNSVPEAILSTDNCNNHICNFPKHYNNINVIGIGMGMGQNIDTINSFKKFLKNNNLKNKKIVIDADAINIISYLNILKYIPIETIITPHQKEFIRLFGTWKNDYEKIDILRKNSKKYKIFIVLKGAYTTISTPSGKIYFNSTGNPGMSTAGSGDVLTGIIVGLLSQKYSTEESCKIGVYLHGLSGDLATENVGEDSLISTDIIKFLPKAFKYI